jgi:hypothetical protein
MMGELKRIAKSAVPVALEKALRYRLLNEPLQAESICRDVLAVDPGNESALVTMLLALTDRFEQDFVASLDRAKELLPQLSSEYDRTYYEGIIYERWGKAQLARGMPAEFAADWFRQAMRCYETAEALAKPDEPDAVLRWNTCLRLLNRQSEGSARSEGLTHDTVSSFGDDMPAR